MLQRHQFLDYLNKSTSHGKLTEEQLQLVLPKKQWSYLDFCKKFFVLSGNISDFLTSPSGDHDYVYRSIDAFPFPQVEAKFKQLIILMVTQAERQEELKTLITESSKDFSTRNLFQLILSGSKVNDLGKADRAIVSSDIKRFMTNNSKLIEE